MDDTSARALHRNAAARTVIRYPALAAVHSRAFVEYADSAAGELGVRVPYTTLWGQSERAPSSADPRVLPDWFRAHNALCTTCMCPLVLGISSQYKRRKRAWVHVCSACGHAQPKEALQRPDFPSVRARKRGNKSHARRNADTPVDAVAAAEARIAAEARAAADHNASHTAAPRESAPKRHDVGAHAASGARGARTRDSKAGLREMLAAHKKKSEPAPRTGGLADFLSQL